MGRNRRIAANDGYRQQGWRGGLSRRRALGVAGGSGATAFLIACGASKTEETGTVKEATRGAGVIAGSQAQDDKPRVGGSVTFHHGLTPPLDPVANTSFATQQIAAYVYPRLLKFKSTRNHSGISDPELDVMIDREVATIDDAERVKAIRAVIARANDKSYYAPVMTGPAYVALQPWMRGFTLSMTYGAAAESWLNVFTTKQ